MPRLLVIDDDRAICALAEKALASIADITTAGTAAAGLDLVRQGDFDAVLLDIQLPDQSGLAVYCEIREHDRRIPVIFMTVEAASNTAIEAMQLGAFDYIGKPLSVEPLRNLVEKAIEQRQISSVPVAISADEDDLDSSKDLFIGRSPAMLQVFKAIGKVAKQNVPILIRGESGTGKELVARALFNYSHRSDEIFLAVNCAALPDNLLESELFGHEKGAFTGAESRRTGKFEQCNGGTLFLDEIGDMALTVQAKFLRVLQEQRFERLGGNKELTTDVRIVAATNRPLEQMVADDEYREDLLYRLNGVTIELPPLRERLSDVPALIRFFLAQARREFNKPDLEGLSPEAVDMLTAYTWPGNVRQLRAVIRRCVLDAVLPVITPDILPTEVVQGGSHSNSNGLADSSKSAAAGSTALSDVAAVPGVSDASTPNASTPNASNPDVSNAEVTDAEVSDTPAGADGTELPQLVRRLLKEKSTNVYAEAMEYMEQYVLMQVLQETDGNQSQAAEILGITRGKLRDRINTYRIRLKGDVSQEK
ncbi:sigma 54-interacting transcriptional regulator [Neorhodopirellula lusitana]|uniref:sigma 54-interacting transcriptional regulator n=1 Tax=Neorhodopirellula lusitana TaxID=445327 RepID=UPI00384C4411